MKSLRAASSVVAVHSSSHGARRAFSAIGRRKAASNFKMPALSPTMTEGNIVSWQVKEGDSFSSGDILVVIETDKANMDLEAQEDGILMKIVAPDDSKGQPVGSRIAVLAEPGDDISSLEMPPDEDPTPPKAQQKEQEEPKEEAKPAAQSKESTPSPSKQESKPQSSSKQGGKAQKQTHPLLPSVQALLHQNGLSDSTADEIPASGPKGRLLKGDVLAYLGHIDKSYPSETSDRLLKLSHLDLSNIQLAEPKPKPSEPTPAAQQEEELNEPKDVDLALPVSLTAVLETQKRVEKLLNTTIPLSVLISRASELANEDLPLPKRKQVSSEELFNAVLGLPASTRTTSRGRYVPQLSTISMAEATRPQHQPDIFDVLTGKASARSSVGPRQHSAPVVEEDLFSVTAKPGEEQRAMVYLERLKTVLEKDPGRLVI